MRNRTARYTTIFTRLFSRSRTVVLVGVVLVVLIAFPLVKKINQKRALDREIAALQAEAGRVEQKNSELRDAIEYLESSGFAEKEARMNLDMKKPGESVVVVKGLTPAESTPQNSEPIFNVPGLDKTVAPPAISNAQRWWDYFFGVRATVDY